MITKIIEQLNTGRVKNNFRFGGSSNPMTPYNVVRKEIDSMGRGMIFRVFTHFDPGQDLFLDDYVNGELSTLLNNFSATDRHGNYNKIKIMQEGSEIIAHNDDGTISKERRFLMPTKIF